MDWSMVAVLLLIPAISPSWPPKAAATEDVLSPILNGICNGVECGKGRCKVAEDGVFGFECECDNGWTQLQFDDHLRFLPCIIPNCTFDSACYNDSMPPRTPFPSISHTSIFDPCLWSFCGRGTCIKTSDFEHRCECGEGYSNLLNISTLPCFKKCRITADCAVLGFTLSNSSSPTASPNFFEHNGRGLVQGSWKIGTELVHFFASFNSHNKLSVVLQLGNVSSSMDKLLKASFGGYSSIGSIIPSLACNFDSRIAHCTRKKSNSTEVQYSFSIFYSCSIC
ncbi:uncharacterized protein [Typha angustifolia]|uniref:uncharacterized protein isoform X2 n=1 Tax=Typha angustifolia TaxID=59011 RepID=UPI003C2E3F17